MTTITFDKATLADKDTLFSWLATPHVQEFWDTTQAHKDDLINFMQGRKTPSSYCNGQYVYWIAQTNGEPFAMLMTIQTTVHDPIDEIKLQYLSQTGHTYGIDYLIGHTKYLGQGYGAQTLIAFMAYFREHVDTKTDTFLIDPASDNPKAKHVYQKAGFEHVSDFIMSGTSSGSGKPHHLLVKHF
jgi:RimJ/RimL family protein N-acetyltransferase